MTTQLGQQAEGLAARYLEELGLVIRARNWRNRWCEIDIVAEGKDGIHFVEVKYRKLPNYGSGFDYITTNKSQRLQRAALMWMASFGGDQPFQIDAISVAGSLTNPEIEYLPNAVIG